MNRQAFTLFIYSFLEDAADRAGHPYQVRFLLVGDHHVYVFSLEETAAEILVFVCLTCVLSPIFPLLAFVDSAGFCPVAALALREA